MPQVLCKPFVVQIDLRNPFSFADMEAWNHVFNQPAEAQKGSTPTRRFAIRFRKELTRPHLFNGKWHRVEVLEVASPALKPLRAQNRRRDRRRARPRPARHVPRPRARGRPQHPVHDGAVSRGRNRAADQRSAHDDRAVRRRRARRHAVRRRVTAPTCSASGCARRQALTLEHAVKRITSEPADFFGISERGRLKPGLAADVAIFDPQHGRLGASARECATICRAADGGW